MAATIRTQAPLVDPDLIVPRAVREGAARAESAQRESIGQAEPALLAGPSLDATPPASPSADPVVLPTAPQEPPVPDTVEQISARELHRLKTVAGRAEADRKRAREATEQMSARIEQLEKQATIAAPAPRAPAPQLPITPQEAEDYGEDFVGMIQRIASHTVQGYVGPLAAQVGRTEAKVSIQENLTMHEQMNSLFPDWDKLNKDQGFIDWVLLPDPYSGAIRQKLMQDAWNSGDARRVIAFFQGFLSEEAALNPAGGRGLRAPAPAARNGAPAPAPPLSLERLAAPGGARSASPAPAEKPSYTVEDITRFYTECAGGKWRGRDLEREAIDRDIHQAQHEGRIIFAQRRFTPPDPPRGMTR